MPNSARARFGGKVFAALLAVSDAGCATFGPAVDEPLRVATVADLAPNALGLRRGETTFDEARATFVGQGLTGVVEDAHVAGAWGTLAVLGADYQTHLQLFQNGRWAGALPLPTHGVPPYGLAVRIGWENGAPEILVLYRDPLDRDEAPPTLLLFRPSDNGSMSFHVAVTTPLDDLVQRHGGMTTPMLLGDSLTEGVLLVARDRDGELWDTGYFLREAGARIDLEPQPMGEAMRCSCVRKYAAGLF